ncbi:MAG: hypothetical protein WC536_00625 [Patescibacteria group bacterium]
METQNDPYQGLSQSNQAPEPQKSKPGAVLVITKFITYLVFIGFVISNILLMIMTVKTINSNSYHDFPNWVYSVGLNIPGIILLSIFLLILSRFSEQKKNAKVMALISLVLFAITVIIGVIWPS